MTSEGDPNEEATWDTRQGYPHTKQALSSEQLTTNRKECMHVNVLIMSRPAARICCREVLIFDGETADSQFAKSLPLIHWNQTSPNILRPCTRTQ
jgi:hypothetical protein